MVRTFIETHIGLGEIAPANDSAEKRVQKARTERSVVVPVADEHGYCVGEYRLFSESGQVYDVDIEGREECTCMDMTFNNPSTGCKHIQRVGIQMTEGNLPEPDDRVEEYVEWLVEQFQALKDAREHPVNEYVAWLAASNGSLQDGGHDRTEGDESEAENGDETDAVDIDMEMLDQVVETLADVFVGEYDALSHTVDTDAAQELRRHGTPVEATAE